jgi:galactose mutarotase-like enzyme
LGAAGAGRESELGLQIVRSSSMIRPAADAKERHRPARLVNRKSDEDRASMKPVELDIGQARATILPERGGLLTQLALEGPGGETQELVWLPPDFKLTESGWPGGGVPVLFPFAGRVFDEGQPLRYRLDETAYMMPLHGFAYALPWELVAGGTNRAALRLQSSDKTRELFPFEFELTAGYELTPRSLRIDLLVRHGGPLGPEITPQGAMPVAMGFHPYFRMPLLGDGELGRVRLELDASEMIQVTPAGAAGKAQPLPAGPLSLENELYANLILGGFKKPEARLVDPEAGLAVTVRWQGPELLKYVVLWTRPGEGFYCLEPWMGLPDAVSTGAGCHWLPPGQELGLHVEISLDAL